MKIINLNAPYHGDISPDQVLDGAKGKLKRVLIIGMTEDAEPYYAASEGNPNETLWIIEKFKLKLLSGDFTD